MWMLSTPVSCITIYEGLGKQRRSLRDSLVKFLALRIYRTSIKDTRLTFSQPGGQGLFAPIIVMNIFLYGQARGRFSTRRKSKNLSTVDLCENPLISSFNLFFFILFVSDTCF